MIPLLSNPLNSDYLFRDGWESGFTVTLADGFSWILPPISPRVLAEYPEIRDLARYLDLPIETQQVLSIRGITKLLLLANYQMDEEKAQSLLPSEYGPDPFGGIWQSPRFVALEIVIRGFVSKARHDVDPVSSPFVERTSIINPN